MALDIKITGIETDRNLNWLIAGNPGAGKTLLSSTAPNPFFASCEGGLLSIRKRKVPFAELKSTSEMDQLIRWLRQSPAAREKQFGIPVDTIVVDTFDKFQKLKKREMLAKSGKPNLSQQEWGELGESMRSYVAALRGLDLNVIFTIHLKRLIDEETGKVQFVPALEGAYRDEIAGDFDLVGVLESKTSKKVAGKGTETVTERILRTQADFTTDWLKDRSGVLPGEFKVNLEDDYDRISALIFEDLDKMEEGLEEELEEIQAQIAAAISEAEEVAEEVAEVAPEPSSKPIKVKASKELDSQAETVNSEQFGQLTAPFAEIDNDEKRLEAKHAFKAEFGNPAEVTVARFEEALEWVKNSVRSANGADAVADEEDASEAIERAPQTKVDVTSPDAVACTQPGCTVKDIDDEEVIELSKIKNGNKPLCAKHLKETYRK